MKHSEPADEMKCCECSTNQNSINTGPAPVTPEHLEFLKGSMEGSNGQHAILGGSAMGTQGAGILQPGTERKH